MHGWDIAGGLMGHDRCMDGILQGHGWDMTGIWIGHDMTGIWIGHDRDMDGT